MKKIRLVFENCKVQISEDRKYIVVEGEEVVEEERTLFDKIKECPIYLQDGSINLITKIARDRALQVFDGAYKEYQENHCNSGQANFIRRKLEKM